MFHVEQLARLRRAPTVIGEYPLEAGLAAWGFLIGGLSLSGTAPSGVLAQLPDYLNTAWGVATIVGGISIIVGLIRREISPTIANAMLLFAVAFAVYAVAVIEFTGWPAGGAVAGLTIMLAVVCYLRSRRLRLLWLTLLKESHRMQEVDDAESARNQK